MEIVILGVGLGLVAYAGVDREPGPGYLGFTVLALFAVLAGIPGKDATIVGWPRAVLRSARGGDAAGLRRLLQPLPPSPRGASGADRSAARTACRVAPFPGTALRSRSRPESSGGRGGGGQRGPAAWPGASGGRMFIE